MIQVKQEIRDGYLLTWLKTTWGWYLIEMEKHNGPV